MIMGKLEIEVESGDSFKMDDRIASLYGDGNDEVENRRKNDNIGEKGKNY